MKNLIFILTDQQHFRTFQANGCPEAQTPHLDRLIREGTNFQNHFVVNPVCGPSRGAIWTGTYPSENGLYANGCRMDPSHRTIAQVFAEAGFDTAHFGKLHLQPTMNHGLSHEKYGFQVCELGEGDQYFTHDDYNLWLRAKAPEKFFEYYHQMGERGHLKAYTSVLPEAFTHSFWVTQRGIDWIGERKNSDQPYFLSLGYFDPHHAWNPCEPYASQWAFRGVSEPKTSSTDLALKPSHWGQATAIDVFELASIVRSYHAMISQIDACTGRLMEALEESGQIENTIIVFSSDHGEFLGNHQKLFKGPFLCDDLLRVPLLVWDGAGRGRERTVKSLTSSIDFFDTLPRMMGISTEPRRGGIPFLNHEFDLFPEGERTEVVSEWRTGTPEVGAAGNIVSIRTSEERYVYYENTKEEEYYRIDEDPYELKNRATEVKCQRAKERMAQHLKQVAPVVGKWEKPEAPW